MAADGFKKTVHTPLLFFGELVCSCPFFFLLFGTTWAGMRVDEVEGLEACEGRESPWSTKEWACLLGASANA